MTSAKTLNSSDVKITNKTYILKTIRMLGISSKIDVAKKTGLSAPTVSTIFNELESRHIIERCGEQVSYGGRKPILYKICPDAGYILAVEVKKKSMTAALFDFTGEIIEKKSYAYDSTDILDSIDRSIKIIIDSCRNKYNLIAIGITLSGHISKNSDYFESWTLGIERTNLVNHISEKYDYPVYYEDLIRSVAYYFKWSGCKSSDMSPKIFVDIGIGVGTSIIIQDEIFYGENGLSGELGHVIIEHENGKECYCGQKGCLETVVSEAAIIDEVKKTIENGSKTLVADMCLGNTELIDMEMIRKAYDNGDEYIKEIFYKVARTFTIALVNMIQLIDPGEVTIIDFVGIKDIVKDFIDDFYISRKKVLSESVVKIDYLNDKDVFLKGIAARILLDVYDRADKVFGR